MRPTEERDALPEEVAGPLRVRGIMTQAARGVLADCREAIAELKAGVHGDVWRRRWITAIVLLRAVGHVLERVDVRSSDAYRRAIEGAWDSLRETKPEPAIFWSFINDVRNGIVKEYDMAAGQNAIIHPPMGIINRKTGATTSIGGKPTEYIPVINSGPFAGKLQSEVLEQAVAWWESYLGDVDRAAGASEP